MDAVSYSDLRRHLKTYLDRAFDTHDPLIITRKNDENLVLLSIHEYNALLETSYLLSNAANAEHLRTSIEQARSGQLREVKLPPDE